VRSAELAGIARLTGDREIAFTSLFARLVLKGYVKVKSKELRAAERAIVRYRFGGSGAAYRGALARAGATRSMALGVIADELRQAQIERRFQVKSPSGAQVRSYRESYSETPARLVEATPRQWWLGRRKRGVAIQGLAPAAVFSMPAHKLVTLKTQDGAVKVRALGPTAPLGAFSIQAAAPSIRAALVRIAQDGVFDNWLMRRESSALAGTTCRRDWLPAIGPMELANELPFLALAS
jgi:hypothetical protein